MAPLSPCKQRALQAGVGDRMDSTNPVLAFICHKCDDLTSMGNVQTVNMEEKNQCNHAIVAGLLFGNFEISDMDQTKNTIDVVRQDEKEVVALVVPKGGKKPGVIFGNFGKSTSIVVLRQV